MLVFGIGLSPSLNFLRIAIYPAVILPLRNDQMQYLDPTFPRRKYFLVFLSLRLPPGSLNRRRRNRGLNSPPAAGGLK